MTRHKVSELEGALLDAAVATCEGHGFDIGQEDKATGPAFCWVRRSAHYITELYPPSAAFRPSSEWAHGGPIIERELIEISGIEADRWIATPYLPPTPLLGGGHVHLQATGPTPLIAAMRAYVASRFGDEVDLP